VGVPGRKPKPVELRIIEGNRGHRKIPENTPKPTPVRPDRPGWLLPYAKREWSRVVPVLEKLGLLTELDRGVLAAYCQAWARFKQAEDVLNKQGFVTVTDKGNVVQRPEVSISRNAVQTMIKCAAEFGMTPSSRGRIELPEAKTTDEDDLD
jgi:P27 family predicted phage terminase small subunit